MWHVPSYHPPFTQPTKHSGISIIAYTIMLLNCSQKFAFESPTDSTEIPPYPDVKIQHHGHLVFPRGSVAKPRFLGPARPKRDFQPYINGGRDKQWSVEVDQHPRCPDAMDKEFHLFGRGSSPSYIINMIIYIYMFVIACLYTKTESVWKTAKG